MEASRELLVPSVLELFWLLQPEVVDKLLEESQTTTHPLSWLLRASHRGWVQGEINASLKEVVMCLLLRKSSLDLEIIKGILPCGRAKWLRIWWLSSFRHPWRKLRTWIYSSPTSGLVMAVTTGTACPETPSVSSHFHLCPLSPFPLPKQSLAPPCLLTPVLPNGNVFFCQTICMLTCITECELPECPENIFS